MYAQILELTIQTLTLNWVTVDGITRSDNVKFPDLVIYIHKSRNNSELSVQTLIPD